MAVKISNVKIVKKAGKSEILSQCVTFFARHGVLMENVGKYLSMEDEALQGKESRESAPVIC